MSWVVGGWWWTRQTHFMVGPGRGPTKSVKTDPWLWVTALQVLSTPGVIKVWIFVQMVRDSRYSPWLTALRVLSTHTPLKFRFLFANIAEEVKELTRVSQLCRYCPPQVGVEAVGWVPRETPRFLIMIIFMIIIMGDSRNDNSNKDNIGIGLQRDSYFLTIPLPPPWTKKIR